MGSSLLPRVISPLRPRDPNEAHRHSSDLELLTDLCFVVAVSQAAAALHHQIAQGHAWHGVGGFLLAFFAIFWAWLNFTWFASAYDNDDVIYRLLTILQILGSLTLAAGIPKLLEEGRSVPAVAGYVVMRIALVTQWLRAAWGDPERRSTDLHYALGVACVQAGWVAFLFVPHAILVPWTVLLVGLELSVPAWAERHGMTTWHPSHVAGRYGEFFIIVLGELILSTTVAIQQSIDEGSAASGLARVIAGGVIVVFSLWWLYFSRDDAEVLVGRGAKRNMAWGFGHYFVFAATAAIGAGLAARVEFYSHHSEISARTSALCVTIPVAIVIAAIYVVHLRQHDPTEATKLAFLGALVITVLGSFTPAPELIAGLVCAALVTIAVVAPGRRRPGVAPGSGP